MGDFPLRGKMSVKLTKGSGKNVGVADKGGGHPLKKGGKLPPLAKQMSCNRSMDEKQDTAVRLLPPSNETKRYEIQKFRVVRLQVGVQNRADSGHRQTAERICRTVQKWFP